MAHTCHRPRRVTEPADEQHQPATKPKRTNGLRDTAFTILNRCREQGTEEEEDEEQHDEKCHTSSPGGLRRSRRKASSIRDLARDAQSVCDGGEEFSGTPPPDGDRPERQRGQEG